MNDGHTAMVTVTDAESGDRPDGHHPELHIGTARRADIDLPGPAAPTDTEPMVQPLDAQPSDPRPWFIPAGGACRPAVVVQTPDSWRERVPW